MERILARTQAWLSKGYRQLYAGIAATIVVLLVLGLIFAPHNGVPLRKVEEMIDADYNTRATSCVPSSNGHDVCRVATDHCRGTLVVKAVDSEIFTVITATPPRLRSTEACSNPETLTPQTSEAG